jgi:hypothetical protein
MAASRLYLVQYEGGRAGSDEKRHRLFNNSAMQEHIRDFWLSFTRLGRIVDNCTGRCSIH